MLLVTDCKPLGTSAAKSPVAGLTFIYRPSLMGDGHERSMAKTAFPGETCIRISAESNRGSFPTCRRGA